MVNQKDVAKKAGVSSATVSAVINQNKFVSEDFKNRVLEAIEELDYEPDIIARSLKINKSNSIGIIVGNILSQAYSIIAKAAEDIAYKHNFNLIVCNSDDNPQKELNYLKVLSSNRVAGIILTSSGNNVEYVKKIIKKGIKIVLLDRFIKGIDCDAVVAEHENAAYNATKYLIEQGFTKIGIICGPLNITSGQERFNGYIKALKEAGISEDKNLIKIGTFKKQSGIAFLKELMTGPTKPEAIFTANLDLTLGAIEMIKHMKLNIPEDISIIGFDDSEWFKIISPPITVVAHSSYDYGASAARLLFERIINNNDGEPIIKRLKTTLLIRGSVKQL